MNRSCGPSFLPDGKRFLYLSQRANSTGYIMLSEPGGRAPRPVIAAISNVQWIEPGYLVFAQEGVLVAQRFDDASGQISGPPIPIAERVDLFLSTRACAVHGVTDRDHRLRFIRECCPAGVDRSSGTRTRHRCRSR